MSVQKGKRRARFEPSDEQQRLMQSSAKQVLGYGGFGSGKCVLANTEIKMADGTVRPIKDVEVGNSVLSLDEDNMEMIHSQVLDVIHSGEKECYRVSVGNSKDVVVSGDHPFYAVSEKTREYGPSEWHTDSKRRTIPSELDWITADELEEQDLVAVPRHVDEATADKYDIDDYWLLGLLIADGSLVKRQAVIAQYNTEVVDEIRSRLPDSARLKKRKGKGKYAIIGPEETRFTEHNHIQQILHDEGLRGCNSHEKYIPDVVFRSSVEAREAFLSGFLIGDGSTANGALEADLACERLRDDVYYLLRSLGVHANLSEGVTTNTTSEKDFYRYRLKVARGDDIQILAERLELMHKQADLEQMAVEKDTEDLRGTNSHFEPVDGDIVFKRIRNMEQIGKRDTYDLEIADTHNFVGNGVVLHNSRSMCEKIYYLNMLYPGNRSLIVRKRFSDVKNSTIQQCLIEDVIPDSHIPDGGHNKSEHRIEHYTGKTDPSGEPVMSEIYYEGLDASGSRSNDNLPRRISGMQFGAIGIDEATETEEGDFVQLLGRLRFDGRVQAGKKYNVPVRQLIAVTNPASKQHHLYQRFWQDDRNDTVRFHLRPEDNPGIPDDYVEQMRDNYSGIYYERYVEGKWVGTEDVIFDEFDRRRYVVDNDALKHWGWEQSNTFDWLIKPPENWTVMRSIDFGYPSPTCMQWWAVSPPDEDNVRQYVMFRELYLSETLIDDIAENYIIPYSDDIDIQKTYADPASADSRQILQNKGIETQSAQKEVFGGIQAVKSQMNTECGIVSGEYPALVFAEDCLVHEPDSDLEDANKPVRTVDEITQYEWRGNGQDKPRKEDDHGMDTMRYLVFSEQSDGVNYDELRSLSEVLQDGF